MSDLPLTALDAFEPLAQLPENVRRALIERAAILDLPAGSVLCREGDPGDRFFLVLSGCIRIERSRSQGGAAEVHRIRAGDYAGLTSIFADRPRSATLTSTEPTRCLTIGRSDLLELIELHPGLARSLLRFLASRFRLARSILADHRPDATDSRTAIAFFDAKLYDRASFDRHFDGRFRLHYFETRLGRTTASLAVGFPVVCVFVNDALDAQTLAALAEGGTRLVALRCAGFNNVDLAAAEANGLTVVRVPAYSPHAVAEHALALLLTLNRRIHRAFNRVREGNFTLDRLVGFDLHGRTAGIVGTGKIGRCMVRICRGLGMQVLGWDAHHDQAFADETGMRYVELDELLAGSDVISLHAPLLPSTRHLINAGSIARMRRGVYIINTSRGGLIDSKGLIEGLRTGQVGGAGLDVYEEEEGWFFEDHSAKPIHDDELLRLISHPSVIVTSHQAFLTEEALANIACTTRDNILAFLAGAGLDNRVAPP